MPCRSNAKKAGAERDDEEQGSDLANVAALRSQLSKAARSLEKQRQEYAVTKDRAQFLEHKCASLGMLRDYRVHSAEAPGIFHILALFALVETYNPGIQFIVRVKIASKSKTLTSRLSSAEYSQNNRSQGPANPDVSMPLANLCSSYEQTSLAMRCFLA